MLKERLALHKAALKHLDSQRDKLVKKIEELEKKMEIKIRVELNYEKDGVGASKEYVLPDLNFDGVHQHLVEHIASYVTAQILANQIDPQGNHGGVG